MSNIDNLEKEKISLEISKLKVPWYKNFEFWKILVPTIAILASLYFTFGKGILDVKKEKLELQKEQLKLEILQFEKIKSSIQDSILLSNKELNKLKKIIRIDQNEKNKLSRDVNNYKTRIAEFSTELNTLNTNLTKDKEYYKNQLIKLLNQEQNNLLLIQHYKDSIFSVYDSLESLKAENRYIKNKIILTKLDSNDLKIIKWEAMINNSKKRLKEIERKSKERDENLKKNIEEIKKLDIDGLMKHYEFSKLRLNSIRVMNKKK